MFQCAHLRCIALSLAALFAATTAEASSLTTLYQFAGGTDGNSPLGGMVYKAGLLYGTTAFGSGTNCGSQGCGTVFSVDPTTGSERVVHAFTEFTGNYPEGALLFQGHYLYGTAVSGGYHGTYGSIFKVDSGNGKTKILYRFGDRPDGEFPLAGLTLFNGLLYGTTSSGGGSQAKGLLFNTSPTTGGEGVLHVFQDDGHFGNEPGGKLIAVGGTLYGTTILGGGDGGRLGTIYKFDPTTQAFTTLYSFSGTANGAQPMAGLVSDGTLLYGTTSSGGVAKANAGTVFKIDPKTGAFATLYKFQGSTDGANPVSSLTYQNGLLYGTTSKGGAAGAGTIFQVDPTTGAEKVLYSFTGAADGAAPVTELTFANNIFYGTTSAGGVTNSNCATGCGTVFKFTP